MKIIRGKVSKPRNVMLYGEHGDGKSYLASTFPSPLFIDVERGTDDIDTARTPRCTSYEDYQAALSWCITSPDAAEFSTIVHDSMDWLEGLVQQFVATSNDVSSIEQIGYGKGYKFAAEKFDHLISGYRRLNDLGKANVFICHAKTVKHSPPNGDSYDRIEPDLHDRIQSMLMEFCDEVLFLTKKTFTRKEDLGFKRDRNIAVATNERILITADTASVVAKNRLGMPSEIPATFAEYAKYIGARPSSTAGNIDGVVTDGSSKPRSE